MSSRKSDLIDRLGRLVMRFQDVTQGFDAVVGEAYDLNPAELHTLSFLWPGPQTASALAREIRLTPAAVTALIDRLEGRGYVERRADPGDRRRVLVAVTGKAAELTAETYGPVGEAGSRMLGRFSKAELDAFARVLEASIALQEKMTAEFVARRR